MEYINPGFVPDVFKEEDHVLGVTRIVPAEILVPDMNWEPYLPAMEEQYNDHFDTYSCTNFSSCNIAEIIHKRRYNEEVNYSDRFSAYISGTVPGRGNSHNTVAEATRKKGFVLEQDFPFTKMMTQDQFFSSPTQEILNLGLKWVTEFEYGYEKVHPSDIAKALKLSPLNVAVDSRSNTRNEFDGYDHSTVLYKFNEETNKWRIFDSYLGRDLDYDFDYPFGFIMRHHYKAIARTLVIGNQEKYDRLPSKVKNFIQRLAAFWRTVK